MGKTYREGDRIEVTQEIWDAIREKTGRDPYLNVGDAGRISSTRTDRRNGVMCVLWDNGKSTNTYALEQAGLAIEKSHFPEIPLLEADDDLLHNDELIVKSLVLDGVPLCEAAEAVDLVRGAMDKVGLVFYSP